jgi:hypothetical protein
METVYTCTRCAWEGALGDLVLDLEGNRFVAGCPACAEREALEDLDLDLSEENDAANQWPW